jgi:hypothetical protein
LELTWRLLRPTRRDLMVIARLVDGSGRVRARADITIGGLGSGTSRWSSNDTGVNRVELQLPSLIDAGRYAVALTVADSNSGIEIPLSAEAGLPPVQITRQYVLGFVSVAPVSE